MVGHQAGLWEPLPGPAAAALRAAGCPKGPLAVAGDGRRGGGDSASPREPKATFKTAKQESKQQKKGIGRCIRGR